MAAPGKASPVYLIASVSPYDGLILKCTYPMEMFRVDLNKGLRNGSPGRILLSLCKSSLLFQSPKERVPKQNVHEQNKSETIEETVGSDKEKGIVPRPKGIWFEGARTNGHGILSPTDEFSIDLFIASMRHKMPIHTVKIHYNLDTVVLPNSSTNSGILHIVGCMMNLRNTATIVINRLPESGTTLRSSLLPAIEASFTRDQISYVAKRLNYNDYSQFIDYADFTKDGDYAKDK